MLGKFAVQKSVLFEAVLDYSKAGLQPNISIDFSLVDGPSAKWDVTLPVIWRHDRGMDIEVKLVHDLSEIRCQGLVEPHIPLFSLMQNIIYMASPLSDGVKARRDNVDINSQPKWLICKSLNIPQSSLFLFLLDIYLPKDPIQIKSNRTNNQAKR